MNLREVKQEDASGSVPSRRTTLLFQASEHHSIFKRLLLITTPRILLSAERISLTRVHQDTLPCGLKGRFRDVLGGALVPERRQATNTSKGEARL